jgi:hypothetical protein
LHAFVFGLISQALQDPLGFLSKLQKGEVSLPAPQKIAEIPEVNWERYTSSVDFTSFGMHRQSARLKRHGNDATEGI